MKMLINVSELDILTGQRANWSRQVSKESARAHGRSH